MRPILRGDSPQSSDYSDYRDSFPELVSRIGPFCSYCERRIATQLAVEHIQPKDGPYGRPDLKGKWENFLLGCVNCNSTKGAKKVQIAEVFLPDRDNTAAAFNYTMNGDVVPNDSLNSTQLRVARNTLSLVGLDKRLDQVLDSNGNLVAIDRVAQRMEAWLIAVESRNDLELNPSDSFRRQIARAALGHGFFTIWMTVFQDDPIVRSLLIGAFGGTATDCFDSNSTRTISPRPSNGLADGSKV